MLRLVPVVALALALAACGGSGGGGEAAAPAGTSTGAAPAEGGVTLSGQTLDGEALSLDEFRGKPLFVNVWASW